MRQVKPSESKHTEENMKGNSVIAVAKREDFWVSKRMLIHGIIQKLWFLQAFCFFTFQALGCWASLLPGGTWAAIFKVTLSQKQQE